MNIPFCSQLSILLLLIVPVAFLEADEDSLDSLSNKLGRSSLHLLLHRWSLIISTLL
ncbi:MAG: hypothetical protein PF518_04340 [Spirochaetaceae bacterium]|nr:hypothetical protein [Spirochaetaceae bacterium]